MDRLTIPDEPIDGGIRRTVVDCKAVKEQAMTIYWRLKAYEDTGLAPEEILSKEKNASWNGWTKGAYIGLDEYGDPKYSDRRYYRCSNCHYGSVVQSPYCPQCGRKMGKENC